jgi:hypothetical protein
MDFFEPKTTVGGYGELHYNYVKPENGEASKTLDFHRFVMFYSHSWSEKWSFKAEVELEHNFVEEGQGELALEQAYVNYQYTGWLGFQFGVVLPSVGLVNEIHEPPTFFGVERPAYQHDIIPTTWFGNGLAVYGNYKDFDYKITVMEGLNSDDFTAGSGIRDGRQEGFKSNANNLLYNFRLDYLGVPGLRFGASFTTNKAKGENTEVQVNLFELHGRYRAHNIYVDAEYGNISYGSGNVENSMGYYFDLGYNVGSLMNIETKVIPFFRYTNYNTVSSSRLNNNIEDSFDTSKWMIGMSILPIDEVSFKIDYSERKIAANDAKTKLLNLGVGYMF